MVVCSFHSTFAWSSGQPEAGRARILTPILQMEKWRLRKVSCLLRGHTGNEQQSQRLTQCSRLLLYLFFFPFWPLFCSGGLFLRLPLQILGLDLPSCCWCLQLTTSPHISHLHRSSENGSSRGSSLNEASEGPLATLHSLMTAIITGE